MSALHAHDFAPLDEVEYKRQARLLRALHCAYPVQVEGRERFIQVISARAWPAGASRWKCISPAAPRRSTASRSRCRRKRNERAPPAEQTN